MARGIAFAYRGKQVGAAWRRIFSGLMIAESLLAPLLIGIALGELVHGVPVNAHQENTGSFWTLLRPFGIFTGMTLVVRCVVHGATFIALKTSGDLSACRKAGQCDRADPVDLQRALPAGHGLQHQPRIQPDHSQQRVRRVLAAGDDHCRRHLPARGPRLHGLDLLRV